MTIPEIQALTPEQRRVKVAELRGDKCLRCHGTGSYKRFGDHTWFRRNMLGEDQPLTACDHVTYDDANPHKLLYPNYCNNLNAMHEAESKLTRDQQTTFWCRLCEITDRDSSREHRTDAEFYGVYSHFLMVHSNADQRATAFIAVMTEGKE